MTIATGINFGTYVLLAADTRVTCYNENGGLTCYEDDFGKVQKTKIGLITGAGRIYLLDQVKKRLQNREITISTQILNIVEEERLNYRRLSAEIAEQDIKRTGWIFSYRVFGNVNPDYSSNVILRLSMIHPLIGNGLKTMFSENYPWVIMPYEATKEYSKDFIESFAAEIKPCDRFETLYRSINYHSLKIAQLIRKIQPEFPSISPYCQIGVHTKDGRRGISPILKNTDSSDIDVSALMTWDP